MKIISVKVYARVQVPRDSLGSCVNFYLFIGLAWLFWAYRPIDTTK